MSDVTVTIAAAPSNVTVGAAEISTSYTVTNNTIITQSAPVDVTVESAPVSVTVLAAKGDKGEDGESDLTTLWFYLASSWTTEPSINATSPALGGIVYDYTYGTTIYYRHVPSPYDPTDDSFYETYSSGVLSNLIATKGIAI